MGNAPSSQENEERRRHMARGKRPVPGKDKHCFYLCLCTCIYTCKKRTSKKNKKEISLACKALEKLVQEIASFCFYYSEISLH